MLSLDSQSYYPPQKLQFGKEFKWQVVNKETDEVRMCSNLHYTFLEGELKIDGVDANVRLTFEFKPDGNVSAHGRTLRIVGNDKLAPVIRQLYARRVKVQEPERTDAAISEGHQNERKMTQDEIARAKAKAILASLHKT